MAQACAAGPGTCSLTEATLTPFRHVSLLNHRHVQLDLKVNSPADAKSVVHDEMEANRKKANASLRTAKQATGEGASVVSKAIDT